MKHKHNIAWRLFWKARDAYRFLSNIEQWTFTTIRLLVIRNLLFWGVKFESELPPEFIIPDHARLRFVERYHPTAPSMSDQEIKRMVIKAWYNGVDSNNPKYKRAKGQIPRIFNNKVFVFQTRRYQPFFIECSQKTLVTILDL